MTALLHAFAGGANGRIIRAFNTWDTPLDVNVAYRMDLSVGAGREFGGYLWPNTRMGGVESASMAVISDPMAHYRFEPIERYSGTRAVKRINGFTKDSAGNILGSCAVHLFLTADDAGGVYRGDQEMDQTTSDVNGFYEVFTPLSGNHYLVAYKSGSPDKTGGTRNDVVGV